MSLESACDGVFFASTCDGDGIYFCPNTEPELVVLPRHDDAVHWLENGFEEPLRWNTLTGRKQYIREPPFHYFEPAKDRYCIEFFTSDAFDLRSLATSITGRWQAQNVRTIGASEVILLFVRAIAGRIQLTQAQDDSRVGIRIDFDKDREFEVIDLSNDLVGMGFYETGRHPTAETNTS